MEMIKSVRPVIPRRFVAIQRSFGDGVDCVDLIDAIADDGTAWWRAVGETDWQQHPELPSA